MIDAGVHMILNGHCSSCGGRCAAAVVPDLLTEDARLLVARLARQLAADDEVEGRRVSDREWALLLLAMIAAVREETA